MRVCVACNFSTLSILASVVLKYVDMCKYVSNIEFGRQFLYLFFFEQGKRWGDGVPVVISLMSASRVAAFLKRTPFNNNRQLVCIFLTEKHQQECRRHSFFRGNNQRAYQFQIHLNATTLYLCTILLS